MAPNVWEFTPKGMTEAVHEPTRERKREIPWKAKPIGNVLKTCHSSKIIGRAAERFAFSGLWRLPTRLKGV